MQISRNVMPWATAALMGALAASASGQLSNDEPTPGIRMDVDAARERFLQANPQSDLYLRAGIVTRVYGKAFSNGGNPLESATNFINEHGNMFGIEANELLPIGPNAAGIHVLPMGFDANTGTNNFSLVSWTQALDDIPVFHGSIRVLVRNEPGFPAVLVSNEMADMRDYQGQFAGQGVTSNQLDPLVYTRHAANQFTMEPIVSDVQQVIWAGEPDAWVDPTLAVTFVATGGTRLTPDEYKKFRYVVDARNGRILYQESMILDLNVSGTVTGRITQGDASDDCDEEIAEPLPYARIQAGGNTTYTDVDGTFELFGSGAQTVTSSVSGLYFVVNDEFDSSVSTETQTLNPGVPYTTAPMPASTTVRK